MKYDIQIDIEPKPVTVPVNIRVDEKVFRDFKFVVKQHDRPMTHVLTKMMAEFVIEHREKGKPKQRALL
jgi:hypothetical protein